MASIQGLQKALDSKTFDPNDFTQDQLILVDELIKSGNLQGYGSINDVIKERAGAAVGVAQEKQKILIKILIYFAPSFQLLPSRNRVVLASFLVS
jgi:hypothetical protein